MATQGTALPFGIEAPGLNGAWEQLCTPSLYRSVSCAKMFTSTVAVRASPRHACYACSRLARHPPTGLEVAWHFAGGAEAPRWSLLYEGSARGPLRVKGGVCARQAPWVRAEGGGCFQASGPGLQGFFPSCS